MHAARQRTSSSASGSNTSLDQAGRSPLNNSERDDGDGDDESEQRGKPRKPRTKTKRRPHLSGVHIPLLPRSASPLSSPSSPGIPAPSTARRRHAKQPWLWIQARRRPRRALLLALVLLLLLANLLSDRVADALYDLRHALDSPGPCEFVSPVEAYAQDLARIRAAAGVGSGSVAGEHTYSPTGHLLVTPGAAHPIPQLLERGEAAWRGLVARQSRTLPQAVAEYERRYGRAPPRGFGSWWEFAVKHKVVLVDEYDGIDADLAPFAALPRSVLRKRLAEVGKLAQTFSISVDGKEVNVEIEESGLKWHGTRPRARDIASLIQSVKKRLPRVTAVFSIFDQPQIYVPWRATHEDEPDSSTITIAQSCAPDSRMHNGSEPEGRSFVYDSLASVDFCQNPYLVPLHGLTIEPHTPESYPKPHTRALPVFSLAKTSLNADILIPPLEQFFDRVRRDPEWEDKTDSRLAWRGAATGISMMTHDVAWRNSPRFRLHAYANNASDAAFEYMVPKLQGDALGFTLETTPAKDAVSHFYDMKLAGKPIQCSTADGTCAAIAREYPPAGHQTPTELYKYKFLFDIDGNGWSGRFRRLMGTRSVVLKAGVFREWFQPHLIPWYHYVPVKLDYSDLGDTMAFLAGAPGRPEMAFDATAKALGHNGRCFVQRMYRYADLQAYVLRLLLEYARLVEGADEPSGS